MPHKKLRYLSDLQETDFPFISLYLHVNAHEFLGQNEKNRIFIKNSFQEAEKQFEREDKREHLTSLRNDAEKIRYFLENNLASKAHGIAVFACDKLGIFEVFHSIAPFENSFAVNSIPHLKQLACHFEESESSLVIMTDKQMARIFSVKLGGFVISEMDMEHEVHRFHKQGGWAQLRYQRHIGNQAQIHYKEVAKFAAEMLDNNTYENFILMGQHDEIKNLEKILPKRVKSRITSITPMDMRESTGGVLEKIISELAESETRKEIKKVEEIVKISPTKSSLGMQDTIRLIEEGRVDTIVIPGYKTYQGWKCGGCLYISKDQHQPGCRECNGGSRETDIVEELIRLAIKNNGRVEIVKGEAADKLEKFEGIGALVRY